MWRRNMSSGSSATRNARQLLAALTAPELVRSCATRSSAAPTSLISRGASIFGAIGQEVVG